VGIPTYALFGTTPVFGVSARAAPYPVCDRDRWPEWFP